jgi:outer membrane protein OmpA-like peptidoglycan-associated protein
MNILFFVLLMTFGISLSGITKQSGAQETIIIGKTQIQNIEVNMEPLSQFLQSRQTMGSFQRQLQDPQESVKHVSSDLIKILPQKTVEKKTNASLKNSKVIANEPKSNTVKPNNRSKNNFQDGKVPLVVKKENKKQVVAKVTPRMPLKEPKLDHKKFVVLFKPSAKTADENVLSTLGARLKTSKFGENQRFQLTAYSSDKNLSKARRMSLMRAISVRSFLIKMGVDGNKITVRALGNNMDAELSNRVDIVLLN